MTGKPQRFPSHCTFSVADSKSLTMRFVNNTQLIDSLPAGGDCSVAPIRVTVTGSLEPDALACAPRRCGGVVATYVTRTPILAAHAVPLPLIRTPTPTQPL